MCYSKDLSLSALIFGLSSSFLLIEFGNKQSYNTNRTIGYFFMYVTLMQLVEYFLWVDIDCKSGLNKLGSLIGPILNHLQPIILLIIASYLLESNSIVSTNTLVSWNALYLLYVIYQYVKYINNSDNLCIKTNDCDHIDWTWKKDFNYLFYFAISFINIINYSNNMNLLTSFIVSYLLLLISIFKFNKNVGEFWCLMVTGIPLINLFMELILNINN